MTPRIKSALSHGAMAFLYALGMTLALLGVTGLLRHGWLAFWVLLIGCGACSAASVNRKVGVIAGCVGAFVGAVWLLIGGAGSALGMASLMRPAFAQLEKAGRKEEEPEEEPDTEDSVQ